MRRPAIFTKIVAKQESPRKVHAISSIHATREAGAETPATATTRPLYIGAFPDPDLATDPILDDGDGPWSASVAVQSTALPDFTPERRWTSVVLGALGILVLAALVAVVITVAHRSSEPAERAPAPVAPSTSVASSPAMSSAPPAAPVLTAPPAYSSVTATASTVVVAPPAPPVVQPGAPQPNPGVRQRLHDLFPRLFPSS